MDTPYGIFEYNTNNFCSYIAYQTDTSLSDIKHKAQITYLDNFLTGLISKDNKIIFIYENEYIDKHYLEDYSAYYVTCFKPYRKTSSRVHFFKVESKDLDYKVEFKKALNGQDTFINDDNYLGYIVIRPIPQTFLAKVCLKTYYYNDRLKKYTIIKDYSVSLFGINLKVESAAFQEQDKILSACATTSLWSFFHAHPHNTFSLPSSSAITRSAYPEENGHHREFPNSGLSTDMICRSLRAYDFAPEYFEFSSKQYDIIPKSDKLNLLREYIFSYCSSGLPLILGVSVKDSVTEKDKGLHAVTILGYALRKEETSSQLVSHRLEKLYVHDDRFGPFLKITFGDNAFDVHLDSNDNVTTHHEFENELYLPDTLIVGLYHKVRIPYDRIKSTCLDLQKLVSDYLDKEKEKVTQAEILKMFKWDIQIKQNKDLKTSIFSSSIENKEAYLTQSWPKYIWSATALFNNEQVFEMIFDATDIDHGDVFLEIIPIDDELTKYIVAMLKVYSDDHFNNKIKQDYSIRNQDNYVLGVIKYFRDKESYISTLSELYGYLKIPNKIKDEELKYDAIINQCLIRLNKENDYSNFHFEIDKNNEFQYIWVIDKEGFLCIGKENNDSQKGHPTLTDGMPARIGGQLKYNEKDKLWEIDPFSGRYSSEYTNEEKRSFIYNVIKYKFNVYFPKEKFICKKYNDR
ncbi:MAG: hypothetical protein KGZ62_01970 [Sulfurimonas sp.]|nr:hypothetical protein [Sulfurimonas sp.]MDX9756524.1 hypothetical protein [Sulfurimonas sp.]